MTSPRQRKKGLILSKLREDTSPQQEIVPEKTVDAVADIVVDSSTVVKPKKLKTGLVELKSQEQVIDQEKEEVKTKTRE